MIPIRVFSILSSKFNNNFLRKTGLIFILVLITTFILTTSISSLAAEEPKEGLWADSITTSFVDNTAELIVAEGNGLLIYDNYQLEADLIEYDLKKGDISLKGNIVFDNGEYRLTGDSLDGNIDRGEFEVVGNVYLKGNELEENKGEESGLEVSSNELFIQEKKELMNFKGDVALNYNKIKASSDTMVYDYAKELANLEGNVQGEDEQLQLSGNKLRINLKNEQMKLLGKAEFLFKDEGEE